MNEAIVSEETNGLAKNGSDAPMDITLTSLPANLDLQSPEAFGIALGRESISAENPAGESVRDSEIYLRAKAQIDAMQSISGAKPKWTELMAASADILERQSKDILVACYLNVGLLKVHGYLGLNAGLAVLQEMVTHHFSTMHPTRNKARTMAFQWLAEHLVGAIAGQEASTASLEPVGHCLVRLTAIDDLLVEESRFGPGEAVFGAVSRELKKLNQRATAGSSAVDPGKRSSEASAPAPSAPAADNVLETEQDVKKLGQQLKNPIRRLVTFKRQQETGDPLPYRLLRLWSWLGIDSLPPHQNTTTGLKAVDGERRSALDKLLDNGKHEQLIQDAESRFTSAPYWLDAHRFTATALDALGHSDASKAVVYELGVFLKRLPGIETLRFDNGIPLADDATREWLEIQVTGAIDQTDISPSMVLPSDSESPWNQIAAQAAASLKEEGFEHGLTLFQEHRQQSRSKREIFHWDLLQADYCISAGHAEIGLAQLEHLDDWVTAHRLDEWEPELSVQIAQRLNHGYRNVKGNKTEQQQRRLNAARQRICRLAPIQAARLFGVKK